MGSDVFIASGTPAPDASSVFISHPQPTSTPDSVAATPPPQAKTHEIFVPHPTATVRPVIKKAWQDPKWNQPVTRDASGAPVYSTVGTHLTALDVGRLVGEFEKKYARTPTNGELNALVSHTAQLDEQNAAKVLSQWGRAADLVGKAADLPFFAAANAAMRSLAPGASPGRSYMNLLTDNKLTFTQKLDAIGSEYGFNAPPDIQFWASQPGIIDGIMAAKPTSAGGVALQIMLGMKADLAKLKPEHPILTGIETAVAEQFNPTYYVAGPVTGLAGRAARAVVPSIMKASEFGAAGASMAATGERIAQTAGAVRRALSRAPVVGDRFLAMQDVYGWPGAQEHDLMVRDMGAASYSAMADFTNPNTLGNLLIPDKQKVVDHIENPGDWAVDQGFDPNLPPGQGPATGSQPPPVPEGAPPGFEPPGATIPAGMKNVTPPGSRAAQRGFIRLGHKADGTDEPIGRRAGEPTLFDRAATTRALIRADEEELTRLDPEAAANLIRGDRYFPRSANPSNPTWLIDVPKSENPWATVRNRFTGGTSPIADDMRTHPSIRSGQDAGLELNPNWDPAGTAAVHASRMRRYNRFLSRILGWANLRDVNGEGALLDIDYSFDTRLPAQQPGGVNEAGSLVPLQYGGAQGDRGLIHFGSGRTGFDAAEQFVEQHAYQAATEAAARHPQVSTWSDVDRAAWIDRKAGDYRKSAWDNMERQWKQAHPNHSFETAKTLAIPRLKGQALREEALSAAVDAHPSLATVGVGQRSSQSWSQIMDRSFAESHSTEPDLNIGMLALDNVNGLVRQGLLSNFLFHPFFNILPLAAKTGVSKPLLARALFGGHIPQEWIEAAARDGASAPNFGGAYSMDPNLRARILSTAYGPGRGGLSNSEMLVRAGMYGSKLNQDVTFGYFEDRVAAVMHHDNISKGMSPAESSRKIRQVLGDYNNLTPFERGARLNQWFYFYTWMKTRFKDAGTDWLTQPQKIMAPIQGVERSNQMQGAPNIGDDPGANPLALSLGKDEQGNWRFISAGTVFPQARFGEELLNMTAGSFTGGGLQTSLGQAERVLSAHTTPGFGISLDAFTTLAGRPDIPEGWNQTLWDPQEPIGEQVKQALVKSALRYAPFQIQSTVEAIKSHDPAALIGAVGPAVYSLPDESNSKRAAAATYKLRAYLKNATDPNTQHEIFDLLGRIRDGDPLAISQAESMLWLSQRGTRALRSRVH